MEKKMHRPAVIILAAGESKRMGTSKHLLWFSKGETFIEHIVAVYQRFQVSKIVVVVNEAAQIYPEMFMNSEGIEIVTNKNIELGRFYSVQLGLQNVTGNCFIQNIDNPFVNVGLLMSLNSELKDSDYVVPANNDKGGHPILLSERTSNIIVGEEDKGSHLNNKLKLFSRKNALVNDPYIRVNINTQEDYKKYFSGLGN